MVKRLVLWLVAATLAASCAPAKLNYQAPISVGQKATLGTTLACTDSAVQSQLGPPQGPFSLPVIPSGITPRQQRRFLRTASRAQARIVRAQPRQVPLIVAPRIDNRGSNGGTYAPKAKAPVATATGGNATATNTPASTLPWGWLLLALALVFTIWRARATR